METASLAGLLAALGRASGSAVTTALLTATASLQASGRIAGSASDLANLTGSAALWSAAAGVGYETGNLTGSGRLLGRTAGEAVSRSGLTGSAGSSGLAAGGATDTAVLRGSGQLVGRSTANVYERATLTNVTASSIHGVAFGSSVAIGNLVAAFIWSWDLEALINGVWTSIAEDVLIRKQALVATRGIDGSDVTNRVASPGSLTCLLDNGESSSGEVLGWYSPENVNMRGNFGRDTLVRLKFTVGATIYYKWRGYITDLEPAPGQYKERTTQLSATDFMQRMIEHKLNAIPVQESQRSDQVMQTILNNMAVAPVNASLDTDKFTLVYALHSEQDERTTAMGATQKVCQTALAYGFLRGNLTDGETFVYQREESRAQALSGATFDDTMSALKINRNRDRIKNRLVGQIHPPNVDTQPTTLLASLDNEIPIDAGDTQVITLRFKEASSRIRVSAKDIVTSLTPDTHYKMSALENSGGSDMNAFLTPTVTAGGNVAVISLQNTGTVRGFVSKLDIYGKGIYLNSPVEIVVESGIADKQLNYDFYYLADPYRAKTFLTHLHNRTTSETPDVDLLSFFADIDATFMGYAMNIDIGDKITVLETVTGIWNDYIINKVTYTIQTNRTLRVDYLLEVADPHLYFILDDSVLNGTNVLSPY